MCYIVHYILFARDIILVVHAVRAFYVRVVSVVYVVHVVYVIRAVHFVRSCHSQTNCTLHYS